MPQDFSGQNLRGRSFKGQNLEGANFSNADIRGVNFSNAILKGASLMGAKTGLPHGLVIAWVILSHLFSGLSALTTGITCGFFLYRSFHSVFTSLIQDKVINSVTLDLILIAIFFIFTVLQGIGSSLRLVALIVTFYLAYNGYQLCVRLLGFNGGLKISNVLVVIDDFASLATLIAIVIAGTFTTILAFTITANSVGNFAFVTNCIFTLAFVSFFNFRLTTTGSKILSPSAILVYTFTLAIVLFSAYISRRVLIGDVKHVFIQKIANVFTTRKGTSFYSADLTDANFSQAILKNTDFRNANLSRTCFQKANILQSIRSETTYLDDAGIRKLLVTGQAQGQKLDYLDLRKLNLSGANLANASFIGTDFYQSSLKKANLTGAILVRTQFESVDLTGTILTSACIEDWVVTRTTKLKDVVCDYIFLKYVNGDKRDQMPPRDNFKPGEFTIFIKNILDTIELYHDYDIKPRVALQVIENLSKKYNATLELVGIRRAENGITLIVKTSNLIEEEKLKEEYYEEYNQTLSLNLVDKHKILPQYEEVVEKVTDMVEDVKSRPTNYIEYLNNKGLFVGGNFSSNGVINMPNDSEYNFNNTKFGGGFAGTGGTQTGGNFYDNSSNPSLAEAATQIQQLLQQLETTNPTTTNANKRAVVNQAIEAIENNPALKTKVIAALNSSGTEALKTAINHPLAKNMMPFIEELVN